MKKTPLLIIPMLTPLMNVSASSLPDEINYSPYQMQYEQASQQVDILTSDLAEANSQLQTAYDNEAGITRQIEELENSIIRTQNIIVQNEDERVRLGNLADDLNIQIGELDRMLTKAKRRRNRLELKRQGEVQRLKPLRQRVRNLTKQVGDLKLQKRDERQKLAKLKKTRADLKTKVDKTNAKIVTLIEKLEAQKGKLANIKTLITEQEKKITTIKGNLTKAKQIENNEKQKLAKINNEIDATMEKLKELGANGIRPVGTTVRPDNPNTEEIKKLKQKLRKLRQEKRTQLAVVKAASDKVAKIKSNLDSANKALAKLKADEIALPGKIDKTKAELAAARNTAKSLKEKLKVARTNIETQQGVVDTVTAEYDAKEIKLTKAQTRLNNESVTLIDIEEKLKRVETRIGTLSDRLAGLNNDFDVAIDQMRSIDRNLPLMRRDLRDLNRNLQLANTDLTNIQDSIIVLNGNVSQLQSQLSSATTDRDLKYQEYIARYDYYIQQLASAKSLGASQTDVAINIARTESNAAVKARSNELGTQVGMDLGAAEAKYFASVRAEIEGYNDGYDIGYASAGDQQRGQKEGTRAGIIAAQDHAQSVLKPQFFNSFFEEALRTNQFKVLDELSYTQVPLLPGQDIVDSEKSVYDNVSDVRPVTTSEINQSLDIRSGLDSTVASNKFNLSQVIEQKVSLSKANNVYQNPSNIPFQSYDCSGVYKGVQVFIDACSAEYTSVFTSKYTNEHYTNFSAQYTNLYESVVDRTSEDTLSANYSGDYSSMYPIAEASGISDGKAQIYKETFAIAKENAYRTEIPKATSVAKAEASSEVKSWVATNAAITVVGASVTDTNLQGGSDAIVTLNLKNISPVAASKPVKVVITSVTNADMLPSESYIQNIPGNMTTSVKDLKFKISRSATSGEKIVVKGKVILPGGKYKAQRVETFEAAAVAALNPTLAPQQLTYDSTPQVKGWRRYKIHRFDIDLSAMVETIKDGYTVEMKPIAHADLVDMRNGTSARTGRLSVGNSKRVSFKYIFKKDARDKVIPMEIKYIYQGKVMRSQIVELRPH